jgi:hypothetical protein
VHPREFGFDIELRAVLFLGLNVPINLL